MDSHKKNVLPVLYNQERELVGEDGFFSDLGLNRKEKRDKRARQKLINETELEQLRRRGLQLIEANQTKLVIEVTAALAAIKKEAEECALTAIQRSDRRIGKAKMEAIKEAAEDFS